MPRAFSRKARFAFVGWSAPGAAVRTESSSSIKIEGDAAYSRARRLNDADGAPCIGLGCSAALLFGPRHTAPGPGAQRRWGDTSSPYNDFTERFLFAAPSPPR